VNKADNYGDTPISQASYNGHLKIVQALIAVGADMNKASNYGYTPISLASENGHLEVVDVLLRTAMKQGYKREDAVKHNLVKEFDKIQQEHKMAGVVAVNPGKGKTQLPSGFGREIGAFLGGKRKTKKSKGKKPSKKRTTRKNKNTKK